MLNQIKFSATILLSIIFILAGCTGSKPAAEQARLTGAKASSNHYVEVSFNGAPRTEDANRQNYSIIDTNGESLDIVDARLSEDGNQVMLITGAQQDTEYQLTQHDKTQAKNLNNGFFIKTAIAANNSTTTFTGSLNAEPKLLTAISLNSTSVLLTFSENMSGSAEATDYYRIVAADNAVPARDVGEVLIIAATLQDDKTTVILTTTEQDNIEFSVKVTNVTSAPSDKRIDPTQNIQPFFGIAPVDSDKPILSEVVTTDPTTIILTFSEPLSDKGDDPSNYLIYYCAIEQTPCAEENQVKLVVTDAELNQHNTQVVLTTLPQEAGVEYHIVVNNVEDQNGNSIDTASNSASTQYNPGNDTATALELPRVAGAVSTGNTTVLLSFSKPMDSSVENVQNYSIVQENVNSEAGALAIISAQYTGEDRSAVLLTTRSQNELSYRLNVVNVKDTLGQLLDTRFTNGGLFYANSAVFAGTPAAASELVDTDGDGLSDSEEQSGYTVSFITYSDEIIQQEVTSDPDLADTDSDGVSDADEKHYRTNPRDADSDDDQLTDYQELNEIYSDPIQQDTDKDGLTDGLEFSFFHTSPLFKDTDGDQLADFDEIANSRNPRISDLPQMDIQVGDMNIQLDYRFDVTREGSTTKGDTQTVSSTLTQARSTEYSKSDSNSHSFDVKLGFEQEIGSDGKSFPEWKVGFSQELSTNNSWTSSVSSSSSKSSASEYAKSLETNQEVTQGETVTRVLENARITVPVYIKSDNDIAFNVKNIVVTALIPSAEDPAKLVAVATLVPTAEISEGYSLGPLLPARGPLEFQQDTIYPAVAESLMANPRGVIFKVANYNIKDELGRDFAFTSQEIAERTAPLVFDHGGVDQDGDGLSDNPERYRVAINYGYDVPPGKRIIFDQTGKAMGVPFSNALQEVLGLTHYDESTVPSESLNADELYNSYSTMECDGQTIMFRIRATAAITQLSKCDIVKGWGVIQPDGSVFPRGTLHPSKLVLKSNRGVRMAYYADEDNDGLPNRAEYLYNCSTKDKDTDSDSLDDRFEVLGARRDDNGVAIDKNGDVLGPDQVWKVELQSGDSYEARARCDSEDSDQDGLSDREEYDRKLYQRDELSGEFLTDADGNLILQSDFSDLLEVTRDVSGAITGGGRTDPLKQDTDDDGISDNDEIRGYYVKLKFPLDEENSQCIIPNNGDEYYVLCKSNPLSADSDGDTLNDGDEIRLYGDPTVKDNDDIGDQDYDGVTNREEVDGIDIKWEDISTRLGYPGVQHIDSVTSSPTNSDSDGDSLTDSEEYYRYPSTNPDNPDTDNDGLTDYDEINGALANQSATQPTGSGSADTEGLTDPGLYFSDPNDADTDNDGLRDGDELKGWAVRIVGQSKTNIIVSDPSDADNDNDYLFDSAEKANKTNPNDDNTDHDVFELSDYDEILLGTNPLDPDDICVRFTYETTTVASDGLDADNKGKLKGDLNMSLTSLVNGIPSKESWVISHKVSGSGSTWYTTGSPVTQGYSAVRLMKKGSYATAWHNAFAYYETASWTNVPNNTDFVVNFDDFTAEKPFVSGTVSSAYLDIKVNSKFTAAVLTAKDIDEHNLEAFCRVKVSVPTLTGLTTLDAVDLIRKEGFRLGTITREINSEIPQGLVISQTPADDETQAKQTAIDLVVSDGAVTVPDLIGKTRSEAESMLQQSGLQLGVVDEVEDANATTALVTEQSPLANEEVSEGATINFTLTVPPAAG